MKYQAVEVLLIVLGTQLSGCFGGCMRRGVECLNYEVVAKHDEYEERQYPATTWVSTRIEGPSLSEASRAMYRKLFYYIQGTNEQAAFVNSTTPVRTKIQPCDGATCPSVFTMSFLIPTGLRSPPLPSDPALFLESEPPKKYVVRTFGGRPTEVDWIEESQKLLAYAKKDHSVEKTHYFTAWYDPPLQIFNRLNEVWLEVRQNPSLDKNDLL